MSYQRERDQFIATMTREGLPFWVAELLLREATGINRRAEMACSSETADRDRVKCPAAGRFAKKGAPCLCEGTTTIVCAVDGGPGVEVYQHADITRITLQDWRAEERIRKVFTSEALTAAGWDFQTEGDPRGYTLRVIPPSYVERNAGRDRFNLDAIGVPCRPSRIQW